MGWHFTRRGFGRFCGAVFGPCFLPPLGLAGRHSRWYLGAMPPVLERDSSPELGPLQLSSADDVELIQRAARGDRAALGVLYDRHATFLLALAVRIIGQEREAEDLLHDVFIEAYKCAKQYDPTRGEVRTWLLMRMRSRALDRWRKRGRQKQVLEDTADLPDHGAEDPALTGAPERVRVRTAVLALPVNERRVLALAYFAGMSSSEIAKELNIPVGTVKSRMARGLARLRETLAPEKEVSL